MEFLADVGVFHVLCTARRSMMDIIMFFVCGGSSKHLKRALLSDLESGAGWGSQV